MAVQQRELRPTSPQELDCRRNLGELRHPGGEHQWPARPAQVLEQRRVREIGRGHLIGPDIQPLKQVHTLRIPRRAQELDLPFPTVIRQVRQRLVGKLKLLQEREQEADLLLLLRRIQQSLSSVQRAELSLLELYRVNLCVDRNIDQPPGDARIAIVIEAHLRDDVCGLSRTDPTVTDSNMGSTLIHDQHRSFRQKAHRIAMPSMTS